MDPAAAALSEEAAPPIGIRAVSSTVSLQARDMPSVSRPMTSSVGPVRSTSASSRPPCSSVPTVRTGSACSASQEATSAGRSARARGVENSEPVEARTVRGSNGSTPWPVVTTRSAPNASAERISEPRFPGLPGRSKTMPRNRGPAVNRFRDESGIATTASSSGASVSFSPSSAMSSLETA